MSAPMLTIHNRHSAACGVPPAVSTEAADLYVPDPLLPEGFVAEGTRPCAIPEVSLQVAEDVLRVADVPVLTAVDGSPPHA